MKTPRSRAPKLLAVGIPVLLALATASARPVPQNLVNGLDKIVENRLLQQGVIFPLVTPQVSAAQYTAEVARAAAAYAAIALTDPKSGNYIVDIMPDGTVPAATLKTSLAAAFPTLQIKAVNTDYATHGVIEAAMALGDARGIAQFAGVRTVVLQIKPIHNVGLVTSQGINQHRVNRINTLYNTLSKVNYDGTGMSIGVMSDSFNSQPSEEGGATTAQADVASGDLPGAGNSVNTQPVVVLEDYNPTPGATNEGRGMCQVVADMAPKARIAFATADLGELEFANNIRALGGLTGFTYPDAVQMGFKGDVVCDDVSYLDEPMFQDGIIAQGVNDVVRGGVTYCSAAANNWATDGYAATFRPVPNGSGLTAATNSALKNTNLDLTGVDASLYAGGFHNFNPNGQDVAQLFNTASDAQGAVFQWNDPYDTSAPKLGALIYGPVTGDSTLTTPSTDFKVTFVANAEYIITEKATPANATENFDAIVDLIDPTGKTVVSQDTGVDETVDFFAPSAGSYTIRVHPYATPAPAGGVSVPTMGHYTLQVNTANRTSGITQDFNLLFFKTDGTFLQAVASNNFASNRPYELFVPTFNADDSVTQVQLVISRANTTAPADAATQLRYVFFGNGISGVGPAEYNDYLTPMTFGHSAAAGANSIAAYSMFRPNLPEDFTSPGPVTIYYNTDNSRLATPQVRRKPDIAAADGANNTFFPLGPVQDVPFDADPNFPNFYGTSCASPHAASVAALIIEAHKPRVLTPAQVKTIMQLNAFPHDLDPYYSSGSATAANGGKVSVAITSDNDQNTDTGSNDPNSWSVHYTGTGYLKTLLFNPEGTGPTGGNPTGGNYSGNAAGSTTADFLNPTPGINSTYYKYTPGMVFNSNLFTAGTATGLAATDVVATFTNAAPAPSTNAYFWTLNLTAADSKFSGGKTFRFNVGRNQQQDAQTPQGMTIPSVLYGQTGEYSADILGSGVYIPEYADNKQILPGMTFSGTIVDGGKTYPFSGRIANKIGQGYSVLDGFGFVNAEAATGAGVPTAGVVSRKVHGSAGIFDLALPLTGTAGIECRTPGENGSYQLIYTFVQTVAGIGNATVTSGTGSVAGVVSGPAQNQVTVNLTGVIDAQHLVVTLSGVLTNAGTVASEVAARMDVLVGDVNASGRTDATDVTTVRNATVSVTTKSNFRCDVDASGRIDATDVSIVRSDTVTALP